MKGTHREWLVLAADGRTLPVTVEGTLDGGALRVTVEDRSYELDARRPEGGVWSLLCGGEHAEVRVRNGQTGRAVALLGHHRLEAEVLDARRAALSRSRSGLASGGGVASPMPGKVTAVLVEPGQEVEAGQGLVVVEAMKMENELAAPAGGTVQEVRVAPGDAVEAGQELVIVG